jgi:hypothetical protein
MTMPQYRLQRLTDNQFESLDIYECVFASDILAAFKSGGKHYHIVTHEAPVPLFEKATAAVASGSIGAGDDPAKGRFARYGAPAGSYVALLAELAFEEIVSQTRKLTGDQKMSLNYIDEAHNEIYRAPLRHP